MKLEQQLKVLSDCGICLDNSIGIDDLLYSNPRRSYEEVPFAFLLVVLGTEVEREPDGRPFCSRVWHFNHECIHASGDYVKIVERLRKMTGNPDLVSHVADFVDLSSGVAWFSFKPSWQERELKYDCDVSGAWVDAYVVAEVMGMMERDDARFYRVEDGQSVLLMYLDPNLALSLQKLSPLTLEPASIA